MQSFARYLLPLVAAPLLGSCVFLLDYDDLQGNPKGPDGAGGAQGGNDASSAGADVGLGVGGGDGGGGGGEAGSPNGSCGNCNDHDPCTIDTCDENGDAPLCMHEATQGLQLDGFETTLRSRQHVRVSVIAGGQQFYFATLENQKAGPKVSLYRLASDGQELAPIAGDLRLEGAAISNVGLAIEELALGEVALHGFVATKLKVGDAAARVSHVVSRADETMTNVVLGATYSEGNPTVFPQALVIGDKVVGAWIQADGTIAVHNVGAARTDTLGSTSLPATTLSLLSTADDQPAVMFTAQSSPGEALGTYVATSIQEATQLAECETRPGDYVSSSVIGTQIPGVWLANVTRAGDDYLTTGSGTLVCANNACGAFGEDCQDKSANGARNLAGATVRFEADPPGVVYAVLALPQLAAKADDASASEGKLSLALSRTTFASKGEASSELIGGDAAGWMVVARNDTDEAPAFAGPDWPAVGILPTKQVVVAWIQPDPTADGTELHVQRYKMCIGSP